MVDAFHRNVSPPTESLPDLLRSWFDTGDELAFARAHETLLRVLSSPSEVSRVLGTPAIDEIRQEVLIKLLDRHEGALREKPSPLAYARATWRNALTSSIRKWGPRIHRDGEVRRFIEQDMPTPSQVRRSDQMDAEKALKVADSLEGKGRLAILLTTRPLLLHPSEWALLVRDQPPPPPPQPQLAIDRDEASRLLFPPASSETDAQRRQRLDSFDKCYKRALSRIRAALEGE